MTATVHHLARSAGESLAAELDAAREVLLGVADRLAAVDSSELAQVAAAASAVVAAADAARAAVVIEAADRGVIAASDHPRANRWVEQSCRVADVPVGRGQARQLGEITATCTSVDVAGLREAVLGGRLSLEVAATVAKVFRRLRSAFEYPYWDDLLEIILDWAAEGASIHQLYQLQDRMIGQYGPAGALDERHDRDYMRRELTAFRRDRGGMLTATLRLDSASHETFSAAVHALSAPHLDEDGAPDMRTPGQRRADALLALAAHATTPNPALPGSGTKARVVVTMTLTDLLSGLNAHGAAVNGESLHSTTSSGRVMQVLATPGQMRQIGGRAGERGYASTGFGGTLSPTEARILACDAQIIPAVLGTDGELLELGRAKRLVTPGLTTALHLRDKGCSYPGCTAPPSWCDGHHIIHWAAGGNTDLRNLTLLCRHHHTVVHRHDHTATVSDDGTVNWSRADGTPSGNTPRFTARPVATSHAA